MGCLEGAGNGSGGTDQHREISHARFCHQVVVHLHCWQFVSAHHLLNIIVGHFKHTRFRKSHDHEVMCDLVGLEPHCFHLWLENVKFKPHAGKCIHSMSKTYNVPLSNNRAPSAQTLSWRNTAMINAGGE